MRGALYKERSLLRVLILGEVFVETVHILGEVFVERGLILGEVFVERDLILGRLLYLPVLKKSSV